MNKIILSGVKPTGRPHLGNYFGAMRQFVELQNKNDGENFFMIADYHALNFIQNAEEMRKLSFDVAADFLAIGLDPKKSVIFKQSDIPEHTELCWIFDTIATIPYLKRAHAYKDTVTKDGEEAVSVGTFTYPMLMAADILLYDADLAPVGQDQKQHIEFARDIAEKFNRIFGSKREEIFKLPEAFIVQNVETVPGIDGKKMSKSYGNTISLFANDKEIEERIMAVITDSSGEKPEKVFFFFLLLVNDSGSTSFGKAQDKLFAIDKLEKVYQENKGRYKVLKEMLIEDLKNFVRPMREKREEIIENSDFVKKVLEEGKEKARLIAGSKMKIVRNALGVC